MKNSQPKPNLIASGYTLTFILVVSLFFLWALPNNLNNILISQFTKSMELSRLQAGLVQSAFKLGYFVFAIPAGLYMQRFGYKTGLVAGLFFFALGCFLFWPAALAGEYLFFLGALFVIASGLAFMELGANTFIVELGSPETAAQRLNLAQAFNPVGGMAGIAIGTAFIFSGTELTPDQAEVMKAAGTYQTYLDSETMRVGPPYIIMGIVVILVAFIISRAKFPKVVKSGEPAQKGSFRQLMKYPHWYNAMIAQFFYLGAQMGTWSYFIHYVRENGGVSEKTAGSLLVGTTAAFMLGRFLSVIFMKNIDPARLMGIYALINIVLCFISIAMPGWIGIWALFSTSFFMSLMYPTIFASGVKGLGPNTKMGASGLIMSVVGGVLLTPTMGYIADKADAMAPAMIIPAVSYCIIAYFSFYGSHPKGPLYKI